ncbi:PEP motif putative anchor domain protein [Oscillatoria nigro-viridis PCC 7112]|uniref:PEP motif putative anchor domain protein n=1 Tax=Phormidium nigroviride PCC 7112 TaxID=179408 RepID=K9VKZ6_9CYAN|nr:PEP-CTERM sorting domain-containing protein [Oscillatoria nigro-viridis]AFZ08606.1 PEP motif putative anchor domain protein [Oscillatoria nigro-viridis PCC 7112]
MKFNHSSGAIAFLLATPLVTSLSVGIAPSSAATIAGSAAEVAIDNFSHTPTYTGTSTNTNTQTIANSGAVISQANAEAFFISNCHELLAANLSQSEVIGSGNNYSGLAQSQAAVIGDFFIDAEETFSFTFQTFLALLTSVDNPQSERARANSSISFWVINTVTNILLDSFQFAIGLDSSSGFSANAFVSNSFKPTQINFNFMAEESAAASLLYTSGVYSRTFNSATNLRLVEVKNNIANTEAEAEAVPEPSTVLGTAIFLGLFVRQRKHKKIMSGVKSKV